MTSPAAGPHPTGMPGDLAPLAPALSTPARPALARVLLATDGSEGADSACRLALALAARGSALRVITVLEPRSSAEDAVGVDTCGAATALFYTVYSQLRRAGAARSHAAELEVGRAADTISRVAREWNASLVVMGLARHRPLDRLLGNETALQIVRRARRPVLAVAAGRDAPPRRALMALGATASNDDAVRAALALLEPGPDAHLSRPHLLGDGAAVGAFAPPAKTRTPSDRRLEDVQLHGDPVQSLMRFAEELDGATEGGLEMIVTGTDQRSPLEQLTFGAVAAKLLRAGRCSLLITPEAGPSPDDAAATRAEPARADGAVPAAVEAPLPTPAQAARWVQQLREFSDRNASRLVALEVDDAELGAQQAARDYELRGVAYDHRDGRVQLMLGDLERADHHLTHTVSAVTAVDVLTVAGRDRGLRIAHAAGQTLLTFPG